MLITRHGSDSVHLVAPGACRAPPSASAVRITYLLETSAGGALSRPPQGVDARDPIREAPIGLLDNPLNFLPGGPPRWRLGVARSSRLVPRLPTLMLPRRDLCSCLGCLRTGA